MIFSRGKAMVEKTDDMIKKFFPNNLMRLGVVILCAGIGIGFGGNKLFGYLVDTSTNLDFQQVNAKIEAVNARMDVDEKVLAEDSTELKDLAALANQINVIAQKVTDIKETVDKLQASSSSNSYSNSIPPWAKDRHDPSKPW